MRVGQRRWEVIVRRVDGALGEGWRRLVQLLQLLQVAKVLQLLQLLLNFHCNLKPKNLTC